MKIKLSAVMPFLRIAAFLLVCITVIFVTLYRNFAPGNAEPHSVSFFAMDTYMEITAYGGDAAAVEGARDIITGIESRMSVTNPDSELYSLNQTGNGTISAETADLLSKALELCAMTDGALDLSVYPIVRAWGFTTEEYRIPAESELRELLQSVNYREINLNGNTVTLGTDMEIDLGAVAKGYAGKQAAEYLRKHGVKSALLNLGGNIQTVGGKIDGNAWRVGVQDPENLSEYVGVFPIKDRAAVTSGGYQRYFTGPDGKTYWHIMDPSSGRPADSGLLSVTVIGKDGAVCDALSTALFVMGAENAEIFWREHPELDIALVLITNEHEILITPELNFELSGSEYHVRTLEA